MTEGIITTHTLMPASRSARNHSRRYARQTCASGSNPTHFAIMFRVIVLISGRVKSLTRLTRDSSLELVLDSVACDENLSPKIRESAVKAATVAERSHAFW